MCSSFKDNPNLLKKIDSRTVGTQLSYRTEAPAFLVRSSPKILWAGPHQAKHCADLRENIENALASESKYVGPGYLSFLKNNVRTRLLPTAVWLGSARLVLYCTVFRRVSALNQAIRPNPSLRQTC